MKRFFNKIMALSALLCVVFTQYVSSQEAAPQSLMSRPAKEVKSQSSFPEIALKEATLPENKEGKKPNAVAKHLKHKKKPKLITASNKAKETAPKSAENAAPSPSPVTSGWFLGVRGAYVPGVIGELGYQFNTTFKLRLMGAGFIRSFKTFSVDGQTYEKIRVKPLKVGLMADWHLWKNGIRLTGGVAYKGIESGSTTRLQAPFLVNPQMFMEPSQPTISTDGLLCLISGLDTIQDLLVIQELA